MNCLFPFLEASLVILLDSRLGDRTSPWDRRVSSGGVPLSSPDSRRDVEVEVGSQDVDERSFEVGVGAGSGGNGLDGVVSGLHILLVLASQIVEDESADVVGGAIERSSDGGDFDGDPSTSTFIGGNTESTSDETTTDPRAEDVAEVEGDFAIGPAFDFVTGVDESLDGGGIDVGDGGEVEDDGLEDGLGKLLWGQDVLAATR